jgi:hypothetical protein
VTFFKSSQLKIKSQPSILGRQDLILIVEILGLGIWPLRDYRSGSKESERHTLCEKVRESHTHCERLTRVLGCERHTLS